MPEEINRVCTDAISDLLFTTERGADENLRAEGVTAERIHFVGNTMIDTLISQKERALATPLPAGLEEGGYAVLTLHRPSNVDHAATLDALLSAVGVVAERLPVVFPVHPRTLANLERFGLRPKLEASAAWKLIDPLPYVAFLGLLARSRMVLTDSGGIQEETTYLGVPCLTMRDNTERPITCTEGTNRLAGTDPNSIRSAALEMLDSPAESRKTPELWDGHAARRIARILVDSSPDSPVNA
jgi:UDP-N-acetylglucosamine 2-epimerase (non-hydrolysing)